MQNNILCYSSQVVYVYVYVVCFYIYVYVVYSFCLYYSSKVVIEIFNCLATYWQNVSKYTTVVNNN